MSGPRLVTGSGLDALSLTSRKPQAQQLRRWVTGHVLPSIGKTGSFTVRKAAPAPAEALARPSGRPDTLQALARARDGPERDRADAPGGPAGRTSAPELNLPVSRALALRPWRVLHLLWSEPPDRHVDVRDVRIKGPALRGLLGPALPLLHDDLLLHDDPLLRGRRDACHFGPRDFPELHLLVPWHVVWRTHQAIHGRAVLTPRHYT
jgi:hypothetical protein